MKTFTRDYRMIADYPEPFAGYFRDMKPCVFDIEATGLDPKTSKVCLTALLTQTDTGIRITQFLAENHYEENRVLDATMEFLEQEGIGYLVTFNGRAYDVPFMNRRMESSFMDNKIDLFDFDLYRYLRKGTDLRQRIGSMSQKSIEDHYGISSDRQDVISGRESVTLFDQYALTGNTTIEKIILTHNREDVLQLHRLLHLSITEAEDVHAAMAVHGFPSNDGRFALRPHISVPKKMLRISGEQLRQPVSATFFPDMDSPLTAEFNSMAASLSIDVPLEKHGDVLFFDTASAGVDLSSDPDCVNGYLIMNSRTANVLAAALIDVIAEKLPE